MASIKCAHCKNTHTSVAEVRACATASRHPVGTTHNGVTNVGGGENFSSHVTVDTLTVQVGNVVRLHEAPDAYWEVSDVIPGDAPGTNVQVSLITQGASQIRWVHQRDIVMVFADLNAATEYQFSLFNARQYGQDRLESQPAAHESVHGWDHVNGLRDRMREHLHREERGKRVGYFALLIEEHGADVTKFYRVRTGNKKGRWSRHLFVDAQASDEFYPVRAKDTLTAVLEGILADPEAAGLLYASELGRCCRCRRTLTDETSRAYGIGPECRKKG